jgi:hypothetical protein
VDDAYWEEEILKIKINFRDEILKQQKNLNRTILMNMNKIRLQRNLVDNITKNDKHEK